MGNIFLAIFQPFTFLAPYNLVVKQIFWCPRLYIPVFKEHILIVKEQ